MSDDFWKLSDGDDATETDGAYDSGGGDFAVIPDNTTAIAVIDNAEWTQDAHMNEYIKLRWSVVKPDDLENRKIFHKLWVKDLDPKAKDGKAKRDKALRMFAAIDANAGGKLAKRGREPEADDMALALYNKPMGIKIKVWSMEDRETGGKIEGNWIAAVFNKADANIAAKPATKPARTARENLDDDVLF